MYGGSLLDMLGSLTLYWSITVAHNICHSIECENSVERIYKSPRALPQNGYLLLVLYRLSSSITVEHCVCFTHIKYFVRSSYGYTHKQYADYSALSRIAHILYYPLLSFNTVISVALYRNVYCACYLSSARTIGLLLSCCSSYCFLLLLQLLIYYLIYQPFTYVAN